MSEYILAIDQGTTSCRAILYDDTFRLIAQYQREFPQYFPQEGWVEHDANEIWNTQLMCCKMAMDIGNVSAHNIISIGITNQRETIVAWDRATGQPIHRAIVWQDRRTSDDCLQDIEHLSLDYNRHRTGLNLDAYFSAPKIRWILREIPLAQALLKKNQLAIGTIDSWLIWKLTGGRRFVTDYSNASRTNLFNLSTLNWDEDLLKYYDIPQSILPQVCDSIGHVGDVDSSIFGASIPIAGIAGDQQAALYGHQCFALGSIKNTFGTGCFLLQNIGNEFKLSQNQLLTTIAWKSSHEVVYAIEGSVFNAGSALKWLKDSMNLIQNYRDIETIASKYSDTDGVYVVPAFTGLGAPYWDMYARGTILGLTRNSNRNHIVRATVESLAYQTKDIVDTMTRDSGVHFLELKVDGGVSESDFLLQFLADILQIPIVRSSSKECTALGAAMMALRGIGENYVTIEGQSSETFQPKMNPSTSHERYQKWLEAVHRSRHWANK